MDVSSGFGVISQRVSPFIKLPGVNLHPSGKPSCAFVWSSAFLCLLLLWGCCNPSQSITITQLGDLGWHFSWEWTLEFEVQSPWGKYLSQCDFSMWLPPASLQPQVLVFWEKSLNSAHTHAHTRMPRTPQIILILRNCMAKAIIRKGKSIFLHLVVPNIVLLKQGKEFLLVYKTSDILLFQSPALQLCSVVSLNQKATLA